MTEKGTGTCATIAIWSPIKCQANILNREVYLTCLKTNEFKTNRQLQSTDETRIEVSKNDLLYTNVSLYVFICPCTIFSYNNNYGQGSVRAGTLGNAVPFPVLDVGTPFPFPKVLNWNERSL